MQKYFAVALVYIKQTDSKIHTQLSHTIRYAHSEAEALGMALMDNETGSNKTDLQGFNINLKSVREVPLLEAPAPPAPVVPEPVAAHVPEPVVVGDPNFGKISLTKPTLPNPEDFWDAMDPRGPSTSEFKEYQDALNKFHNRGNKVKT